MTGKQEIQLCFGKYMCAKGFGLNDRREKQDNLNHLDFFLLYTLLRANMLASADLRWIAK